MTRSLSIAFAYVGVLTGAGLASGQELLQYFTAFGKAGLVGIIVVGFLHTFLGAMILQLGSYFQASEHDEVLQEITHPWINRFLDLALVLTCFVIGFVMIAGAGANLNQQFGLPVWLGSALCAGLVILVGHLDFDKVQAIIGSFTILVIGFIGLAAIHTFLHLEGDFFANEALARSLPTTLPNIWVSVINYFSMCFITGASMAIVLGGNAFHLKEAGRGGLVGGLIVGLIGIVIAMVLYVRLDQVMGSDIPMLKLVEEISPILGFLMSLVIYAMIFNTAMGLYYALARRFSGDRPRRFSLVLIGLVLVGFALSFVGFKTLIAYMYPMLGYIGLLLIGVVVWAWMSHRGTIRVETGRRSLIMDLSKKHFDDNQSLNRREYRILNFLIRKSNLDDREVRETVRDLVEEEKEEDREE
ncbi:YkvI family membrane protein [Kallipyga massiliensis]|uniref:YkvI family membrane protein n=1 Tax=Kallipyga massiliensis TaxID=1472764 RepID=UPI0004AD1748|nr:hypothetical protein [Kallipyga massiliensis]